MGRLISGIVYAALALMFALVSAYLLFLVIGRGELLAYALVLVFALGSVVALRSARESLSGPRRRNVRSD